jgi:hypothetical protein
MRGGDSHYYRVHIVYRPTNAEIIAQHCRYAVSLSDYKYPPLFGVNPIKNTGRVGDFAPTLKIYRLPV